MFNYKLSKIELIEFVRKNPTTYYRLIRHRHTELFKYVTANMPGKKFNEKLYRYCYDVDPVCLHCGSKDIGFLEFTTGYRQYCSRYCTSHSDACREGQLKFFADPNKVQIQIEKSKETQLIRYGQDHWRKTPEGRKHTSNTSAQIIKDRFPMTIGNRNRKQYTASVRHHTNLVYEIHKDKIDPLGLRSMDLVLDHVYSVFDGFKNNVPIDVICHWTNLKLISKRDNSSKGPKSTRSLEELYESYNREELGRN
jgi:hypothetical protein